MKNNVAHWWTWNVPLSTGVVIAAFCLGPLLMWAVTSFDARPQQQKLYVLAAVIAVAVVPIIIRWPVVTTFGLYVLFAYSFDSIPLLQGMALNKPVGIIAAAVLMGAGLMQRRLGRPPSAALWWSLFVVWAGLSTAWSIDEPEFSRLIRLLSNCLLYLVAVSFRPTRRELYLLCVLVVVGGVMAAGAGYLFGVEADAPGNRARAKITIGDQSSNPNTLGGVLILPLAFAVAGFVSLRSMTQRMAALGCIGLIGVGIYISMSRTALVAMILMISVLAYRFRARWQIIAAMVVLLAFSAMMPDQLYRRIASVGAPAEDASGAERIGILKAGLESLERFGVFGAGLGNFADVYLLYAPNTRGWGAHNTYLMVWVELGIVGLVLILGALGSALLAVQKARRAGHGGVALTAIEAACFASLAAAIFGDVIYSRTFWLLWTLVIWAIYCERRSDQAPGAPAFQQ